MGYANLFDIAREQMYPTPYQNSTLLPLLLLSLATQKHSPDTTTDIRDEYDYIIVGAGTAGSVVAARLSEIPCVSVLLLEAGEPPPLLTDIPAIPRSFIMTDLDWDYLTEPQKYTGEGLINRQMTWPSGKTIGGSSVHNGMTGVRGTAEDYDNWERSGARGWSSKDVFPYFIKLEDNVDPDILSNGCWCDPPHQRLPDEHFVTVMGTREQSFSRLLMEVLNVFHQEELVEILHSEGVCSGFHGVGGPVTFSRPRYNPELRKAVIEASRYLGYPFGDTNTGIEYGFSDHQGTIRRGQRCSTAKAYLVPSENRTNLDIVSGAFVTKVLISDKTAVGVQFDLKGHQYEVSATKEVIMSAGTVNTPQLLILSGIGPRETLQHFQIPEVADLPVGLNFQDHCAVISPFVTKPSIPSFDEKLGDPGNVELYINKRVGPLTSTQGTVTIGFFTNNRWDPPSSSPDHQIYFMEGSSFVPREQLNIKPLVYQQYYGPYENETVIWCVSSLQHPKSRGYISIRSTDPYDPPVIDPNYFENPNDMYDMVSGMKACLRVAETPPMQKLGVQHFKTVMPGCEEFLHSENDYLECIARTVSYTLSHQVGTVKMGDPKDQTTVVDPELRVKGIKGLRVVDASVMPRITSGNTNLPVTMIAEKASDIIKDSINCH